MGVYLSEPETTKKTHQGNNKGLKFTCSEMQGWRKNMEDAAIHELDLGDGNALFAVFDGHGGPEVSEYVSKEFTKILLAEKAYKDKNYIEALDITFRKMDEKIEGPDGVKTLKQLRNKSTAQDGYGDDNVNGGTGCTANVVLMTDKKIYCANAGDSRGVLSRQGKAVELSFDHKPESPEEEQRIVAAGGNIVMGRVNGGLNLTRSFGDFDYKRKKELPYDKQMITCKPDIKEFNRQAGDDFILMGCDGIWERYVQNSQGLIDIVERHRKDNKDQKKLVEDLLDELLAKDTKEGIGCDNMTSILIYFTK